MTHGAFSISVIRTSVLILSGVAGCQMGSTPVYLNDPDSQSVDETATATAGASAMGGSAGTHTSGAAAASTGGSSETSSTPTTRSGGAASTLPSSYGIAGAPPLPSSYGIAGAPPNSSGQGGAILPFHAAGSTNHPNLGLGGFGGSVDGGMGGVVIGGSNGGIAGSAPAAGGVEMTPPDEGVVLFAAWSEHTGISDFIASWHNGTDRSIFVDARCAATWSKLQNSQWSRLDGMSLTCPDTTGLVELLPGRTVHASSTYFMPTFGTGIYRLDGTYWDSCALSASCSSPHRVTSAEVRVQLVAGAEPRTIPTVNPGELHAACSDSAPCPLGQTAIQVSDSLGGVASCSCEVPCIADASICPMGLTCERTNDGRGTLCQ